MALTGEMRGTVRDSNGDGVGDAAVYLMPQGVTDTEQSISSTVTEADGSYVLMGVDPGTYDLLAEKETQQGSESGVSVTAGGITLVDLTVQ